MDYICLLTLLCGACHIGTSFEKGYESLGCWKDTGNRAIATLEGTDGRLAGSYGERKNAIEICFEVAKSKGFPAFAVQNGGWCAASSTALETYKKYGAATNCVGGKGGGWANDVYKITGCPQGWAIFGDNCYRLLPQRIITYSSAEKICQEYGAELVSLETKDENDFVENILNEARDDGILSVGTQPKESTDIWLSARRPNIGSPFTWKAGSFLGYSDWHAGQPSSHSDGTALCMQTVRNSGSFWAWYVTNCDGGDIDNAVVCEKKQVTCPTGWTSLATGCYKFVNEGTYQQATTNCENEGGFLIEVESQEELDTALQFYKDEGISESSVWFGASDLSKEGEWTWNHSGKKLTFTAWYSGEPNGGTRESCLHAYGNHNFQWNDVTCSYSYRGLCEHDVIQITSAPTTTTSTTKVTTPAARTTLAPTPGSCEVHVGNSATNAISATVSEGCVCPAVINKSNWLAGDTSHDYTQLTDEFALTQDGSSLVVQRTDSNHGWGMDLTFMCSRQGTPSSPTQSPSCPTAVQPTCPPTPSCPTIPAPTCPSTPKSTCPPTVTCPEIPEPTKCPTLTTTLAPTCPPIRTCPTIPEPTKCPTLTTKPIPTCPAILACPTTVSSVHETCSDKGCKNAFKGLGICVDTSIADWSNVSKIIDFTAETKDGKCGKGCNCKCFKHTGCFSSECDTHNGICLIQELEDDNDNRAFFIPGEYTKAFPCDESLDCHCYLRKEPITQKPRRICKQTRKCTKKKGKCYGTGEKAPEGAKYIKGMCGKKTGCKCYKK